MEYLYVYRHSIYYVIWSLVLGLSFIVGGVYFYSDTNTVGIFMIVMGILNLVVTINEIKQGPIVKLSKQGIWTNSLGFKTWGEVARVKIENKSFHKYLSKYGKEKMFIYLVGDENTKPSGIIDILGLANKKHLEVTVNEYLVNYIPETSSDLKSGVDSTISFGNSQIFECDKIISKWKNNALVIVLCSIGLTLLMPFALGYLAVDESSVLTQYGYLNSVILSGAVVFGIFAISYIGILLKCNKL